ncbi:hypothetical protein BKA82DRAFT_30598 [Pisolithus tinctorius]|uniref:Uncharacterized protein n=1 Tax=Pisolithus tinctorius Marx 270 TaxID=870435 RepID=A0A0C3IR27_PISTI|nr:hypothetical protein BKA82DRAFT_30598 [Pisolithus tinctorius]KIN99352.1 hypothetical protein M404DRAFT_30598 [Pisolithus tinctorius Marx 270]
MKGYCFLHGQKIILDCTTKFVEDSFPFGSDSSKPNTFNSDSEPNQPTGDFDILVENLPEPDQFNNLISPDPKVHNIIHHKTHSRELQTNLIDQLHPQLLLLFHQSTLVIFSILTSCLMFLVIKEILEGHIWNMLKNENLVLKELLFPLFTLETYMAKGQIWSKLKGTFN